MKKIYESDSAQSAECVMPEVRCACAVGGEHAHEHGESSRTAIGLRLSAGAAALIFAVIAEHFLRINAYVIFAVCVTAYVMLGYDVIAGAVKNIFRGKVFDESLLMSVSTVAAFAIGRYSEAVAVMLFYQAGEFLQDMATDNSRRSISSLMDLRPDSAAVMRDGTWIKVAPEDVDIGETILIKPGERVPLDGEVAVGESALDTSSLTGESMPRQVSPGMSVMSGCVNISGSIKVTVTKKSNESTAAKILDIVENAASVKSPAENFMTKFSRYYTPSVMALAFLISVVPPLFFSQSWGEWISRGCTTLVVACPCALVISIPLTFFGGLGAASKKGILVKGSNYLDALAHIDTVVFDKTGTITKGTFEVTKVISEDGFTADEVLKFAAHAECMSNHPIAKSVCRAYAGEFDTSSVSGYTEYAGRGVCASYDGHELVAGGAQMMAEHGIETSAVDGCAVYVAYDGVLAGCVILSDTVKSDAVGISQYLEKVGVTKTVMLTGDGASAAQSAAAVAGIDEYYHSLLPSDKVECLEELIKSGLRVAFVGDGVNDAPVLARADVGIAMGGIGSDAAIEAADAVIMNDEVSKIAEGIKTARETGKIVRQNIVFALGVKMLFIVLGMLGAASMWTAVFGDVGVMLLAVLNSMRILKK